MPDNNLTTNGEASTTHIKDDAPVSFQDVSVHEDYEEWERVLLNDDNKASVPGIPAEAMRRENMYED